MNRIRILLAALGVIIAAGAFALAHPPANFDPALHGWFESLKQPGTHVGCCSESDCRILHNDQWRQTKDGYQISVRQRWVDVPPDKILEHEPNPTGSVVACYREGYGRGNRPPVYIYCFVRGTEA
jgi:hypothetical protein